MAKKKNNKTKKKRAFNEFENPLYLNECKRLSIKGQGTPPAVLELKDVVANVDRLYVSEAFQGRMKEYFNQITEEYEKENRKVELSDSEEIRKEKAHISGLLKRINVLFSSRENRISELLLIAIDSVDSKKGEENHADYITFNNGFLFLQTLVIGGHNLDGLCIYTILCNINDGTFSVLPNNHNLLPKPGNKLVKDLTCTIQETGKDMHTSVLPGILKTLIYLNEYLEVIVAKSLDDNTEAKEIDIRKRGISRRVIEDSKKILKDLEETAYEQSIDQCRNAIKKNSEGEYSIITAPLYIKYQEKFDESDIVHLASSNLEDELGDVIPSKALEGFLEIPRYFDDITIKLYGNVSYHIEYDTENSLIVNTLLELNEGVVITSTSIIEFSDTGCKIVSVLNKLDTKHPNLASFLANGKEFNSGIFLTSIVFSLITLIYEKLNAVRRNNKKKREMTHYIEEENNNNALPSSDNKKTLIKEDDDSQENIIEDDLTNRVERIRKIYNLEAIDNTIHVVFRKKGLNIKTKRKPMRKHKVPGFWRHYKSGKTIWINPFVRGKRSEGEIRKEIHFK